MPNFNFVRTPPVIYLPAKGGGQLKLDTQQVQQPTNTDWKRHIAVCDELTGGRFFFRPMQGSGDERDAHICLDWETVTSMSAGAVLHPSNQTKIQATPADLAWFNTRWHEAVRKRQEQNLRGERRWQERGIGDEQLYEGAAINRLVWHVGDTPSQWHRAAEQPLSTIGDLTRGGDMSTSWTAAGHTEQHLAQFIIRLQNKHLHSEFLTCNSCEWHFAFTVGEQESYKKQRLTKPVRCVSCRTLKKAHIKNQELLTTQRLERVAGRFVPEQSIMALEDSLVEGAAQKRYQETQLRRSREEAPTSTGQVVASAQTLRKRAQKRRKVQDLKDLKVEHQTLRDEKQQAGSTHNRAAPRSLPNHNVCKFYISDKDMGKVQSSAFLPPHIPQDISSCRAGGKCLKLHSNESSALKRDRLIRSRRGLASDEYLSRNPVVVVEDLYGDLRNFDYTKKYGFITPLRRPASQAVGWDKHSSSKMIFFHLNRWMSATPFPKILPQGGLHVKFSQAAVGASRGARWTAVDVRPAVEIAGASDLGVV